MRSLMERSEDKLEIEYDRLQELKIGMARDLEDGDYAHLARLAAQANECKGKIAILEMILEDR